MIPILYPAKTTVFSSNGLGGLPDATACIVTEERNGAYYLEMTYPICGLHHEELSIDRIILARPADGVKVQPFRIVHISRPIDGLVTVEAQHVSYQLASTITLPVDVTSKYAQEAMDALKANATPAMQFSLISAIQRASAEHYVIKKPTSIRNAIGGFEGSLLDVFGGELEWDQWTVKLLSARGVDSGVTIEYGKNMTAITADTDARNLITGALAFAEKDGVVRCGEPAYSQYYPLYADKHMTLLDLSSNDPFPTVSELTAAAQQYVSASNIGQLATTIEVSFVPLWQTAGADRIAQLQRLHLCDTVTVEHPGLRIQEKAKVVKTVYDVLRDRYESITVGTIRKNVADTISSLMSSSGSPVSNLDTAQQTGVGVQSVNNVLPDDTGNVQLKPSDIGVVDLIYPIGTIYMSVNSTSPATLFGGTWTQLQNRFLLGAGSSYTNGATGGAATVTLTTDQLPKHNHEGIYYSSLAAKNLVTLNSGSVSFHVPWGSSDYAGDYGAGNGSTELMTGNTGGGAAHNNMPPYLVVYMWKRTA